MKRPPHCVLAPRASALQSDAGSGDPEPQAQRAGAAARPIRIDPGSSILIEAAATSCYVLAEAGGTLACRGRGIDRGRRLVPILMCMEAAAACLGTLLGPQRDELLSTRLRVGGQARWDTTRWGRAS